MRIPDKYHFIFGLKPQIEPFHLAWYLCLRSCVEVNKPAQILFHYHNEPYGEWWERIKPELKLVYVEEEEFIKQNTLYQGNKEGRLIQQMKLQYAHQADFIRLRALLQHGGVYADIDTLFVKPYPDAFFSQSCIMGRETIENGNESLCNALIMAEQKAEFIEDWLLRMYEVFDGTWSRHSCLEPALLSKEKPDTITVVDKQYFFNYSYNVDDLGALFGRLGEVPEKLCSIHMWSHLWWDSARTDFISFHGGMLTEDFIRKVDTTYNLLARQYLD